MNKLIKWIEFNAKKGVLFRVLTMWLLLIIANTSLKSGEFLFDDSQLNFGVGALLTSEKKQDDLLTAKIIAIDTNIKPNQEFTVALELKHQSGHYSYWLNPGGPGQASIIKFILPPGYKVVETKYPTPRLSRTSFYSSYIYDKEILILFVIKAPENVKDGDKIPLAVEIKSQVCTPSSCIPVELGAEGVLTVNNRNSLINKSVLNKAELALPKEVQGWQIVAESNQDNINLIFTSELTNPPEITEIYFFDNSQPEILIDAQKGQVLTKIDRGYKLSLPIKKGKQPQSHNLNGVVIAEPGWSDSEGITKSFNISLPMKHTALAEQPKEEYSAWIIMLFAFLGGLILNVMPCVFPVISLKIMGFVNTKQESKRQGVMHALAYTAGVLVCFWILAVIVIVLGRGWGAQLQSEIFVAALAYFFLVFALNMAGVFEVGLTVTRFGQGAAPKTGLASSFYSGLLATVVATPCSAPFLGPALAYGLSLPIILALGVFTLMALGLALPYIILAIFPVFLKVLPKPGQWMVTFKQALSFPLFATAAYMYWVLSAMVQEIDSLKAMLGLLVTAFACWLYGKMHNSKRKMIAVILPALILMLGVWFGYPTASTAENSHMAWQAWSPELTEKLLKEGKPVYIDFTARWCATCQVNKHVYNNPEIQEIIKKKGIVLLKADWTTYDERITKVLKDQFSKAAVPVTVFYQAGDKYPEVLPEILTVNNVKEALVK